MARDLNNEEIYEVYQLLHPLFEPGINPDALQDDGTVGSRVPAANFQALVDVIENGNYGVGAENAIISILACTAQVQRVRHEPHVVHADHGRQGPLGFHEALVPFQPLAFHGPHERPRHHGRHEINRHVVRSTFRQINIFLHCHVERQRQH